MITRASLQATLARRLDSESDARWIVEEVLGRGAGRDATVGEGAARAASAMAGRVLDGEPLQYVLGSWSFRTLELTVDPRALIPRPETEHVVDVALAELDRLPPRTKVAVDLGTGSGAIALSLASERSDVIVWATDADAGALSLAAENRARVGVADPAAAERVRLRHGDWFDALPSWLRGAVDLVVANPPYVSSAAYPGLEDAVRREPRLALVADDGSDGTPGFAAVEAVLAGASGWLTRDGAVVVEIGEDQGRAAEALALELGFVAVRTVTDLAGRERAVVGRR